MASWLRGISACVRACVRGCVEGRVGRWEEGLLWRSYIPRAWNRIRCLLLRVLSPSRKLS